MVTIQPGSAAARTIDIRPARMDDVNAILRLHCEAFADKFGAAFGARGTDRGIAAMAEAWRRQGNSALRGMLVACVDSRVIGTITLRIWEMGSDDTGAAELAFHQILGSWGALRSIFAFSLLDHQIDRAEGYITDVAVLGPYRRQGVARALLASAEEEARLRRKRYLGLYVSAANHAALRLYRGAGFTQHRIRRSLLARWVLGQRIWIYMRKDLL